MNRLKEFVKKKKLDSKFKKLGGGRQLGGAGGSPQRRQSPQRHKHQPRHPSAGHSSDRRSRSPADTQPEAVVRRPDSELIAAAAEKRAQGRQQQKDPYAGLTPMQKMVKMKAKKELEEEQRRLAAAQQQDSGSNTGAGDQQQHNDDGSDRQRESTIRYTCEIFDDDAALPKSEMLSAIESTLYEHMAEEPLGASVWLLYTFCRDDEQRAAAVDTIRKYVQNIIDHPTEAKYLQIRQSNRVFAEKVLPVKGAVEFLYSIGFREELRTNDEQGTQSTERYLVMSQQPSTSVVDTLRKSLTALLDGKPIAIRVYRDMKVFRIDPDEQLPRPDIPPEFFKRTADEIRQEQLRMTAELEQMMTLRTKTMREADNKRKGAESNPFKYCYIRVRFPNNFLLQGIFNVYEKIGVMREFVAQHLSIQHGTFTLTALVNHQQQQLREEQRTLLDYGLAPSAVIHFDWDTETKASLSHGGHPISYLTPEHEACAQPLHC